MSVNSTFSFLPRPSSCAGLSRRLAAIGLAGRRARNLLLGSLALALLAPPGAALAQPTDTQAVLACAIDLMPQQAAGECAGQLVDRCMEGVTSDHARRALECWAREEQAWADWAEVNADDASDRLGMLDPGAPARIAEGRKLWAAARDVQCGLHRLAWPDPVDGPMLEARCRVLQGARQAVDLYWLGVP